jgi:hypothetical protein
MSQGATFMRPGAMAWGQPGLDGQPPANPATPVDVTFPGENEPDQVDAWISAYAEPFYIRA